MDHKEFERMLTEAYDQAEYFYLLFRKADKYVDGEEFFSNAALTKVFIHHKCEWEHWHHSMRNVVHVFDSESDLIEFVEKEIYEARKSQYGLVTKDEADGEISYSIYNFAEQKHYGVTRKRT